MIWQLRTYTIKPGEMDGFLDLWRNWVVPARERLGFEIRGGWFDEQDGTFIWLVGHAAPDGWEAIERHYYEEGGRENFPRDPKDFLAQIETRLLSEA
ncbi:unannotated protein [freshwater metagenome]|uniref:Unannotated protein n=1 Tax=freshwater metagenome TaxID=449393 RepID=A0A6J7EAG2_9ZZZZ|nr:NIPSNAP family containing protein [Actinomycetota bacterium]